MVVANFSNRDFWFGPCPLYNLAVTDRPKTDRKQAGTAANVLLNHENSRRLRHYIFYTDGR